MAHITINDLNNLTPAGAEFFTEEEGYLENLSEDELNTWGGQIDTVVSIDNRGGFISIDDGKVISLPNSVVRWPW